jgi:hypothetical protein
MKRKNGWSSLVLWQPDEGGEFFDWGASVLESVVCGGCQ